MIMQIKSNTLASATFVLFMVSFIEVQAENHYQTYQQDHETATKALIKSWANRGSYDDMAMATMDIMTAEASMATEMKSLASEQFVMHLTNDGDEVNGFEMTSDYDFPVFAYRVFKYKVRHLTGFQPQIKDLFINKQFEIYSRLEQF